MKNKQTNKKKNSFLLKPKNFRNKKNIIFQNIFSTLNNFKI